MLFREIIIVYFENHMTHTHHWMEKMESFLMLQQVVHTVNTMLYGIKLNCEVGDYVGWVIDDIRVKFYPVVHSVLG